MFTKRHYTEVAKTLNEWLKGLGRVPNHEERQVITRFEHMFEADSSKFSREAFLDAVWKEVV